MRTPNEMRISYWSSDVCSSDLRAVPRSQSWPGNLVPYQATPCRSSFGLAARTEPGQGEPMEAPSLYVRDGDGFVGTVLTQGSWDPGAANGGAVLALLGQCLDEVPSLVPMSLASLTADLVLPVPIGQIGRASCSEEGSK